MDKRYVVEGNLDHDNRRYDTGDIIVLNEAHAALLLDIGRVILETADPESESGKVEESDERELDPESQTADSNSEPSKSADQMPDPESESARSHNDDDLATG